MVADALIYHPSLAHSLRYTATTIGRDKLLRLIQYFARFYAWYLLRTNGLNTSIASLSTLKAQLGLVRKVLRVGKNVEHLKLAAEASDARGGDAILKYATVGRQLGYAGYLTMDAGTVLDALGVRKSPRTKRLQTEAYRFWAFGLACSVLAQTYKLHLLRQREAKVDAKEGAGVVEGKEITLERFSSKMQLVSDFCDLTIPLSALGWVNLDDGIVGLAGTASSAIGIYAQWKKTAKAKTA